MLEDQVAYLLQRYLGNYVIGLNKEALKISVWRGDVELKNMQLKPEALNALKLPVKVKAGFLGSVRLKVPWSRLGQDSVVVFLDQIFLLAEPATEAGGSTEDGLQEIKRSRIQEIEMKLLERAQKLKLEVSKSWLGSLIGTIIGNLKLSISNVHIRYEDVESNPGHPFAAGVVLGKLSAATVDDNGTETFISGGSLDHLQKLVELDQLGIYLDSEIAPWQLDRRWEDLLPSEWGQVFRYGTLDGQPAMFKMKDHFYILQPVSGNAKYSKVLDIRSDIGGKPLQKATVILDDVTLCLSKDGYSDILKLADNFASFNNRLKNAHYRPLVSVKSSPQSWWIYAYRAVSDQIKKASGKFSWEQVLRYARMRKLYISLYVSLLKSDLSQPIPNRNRELEEMDKELSIDLIIQWRMLAHKFVEQSVEYDTSVNKQKSKSWWSFGRNSVSPADEAESFQFTDEDWKQLNQLLGYKEDSDMQSIIPSEKPDTFQTLLEIHMKYNASKIFSDSKECLAELSCTDFDCFVKIYPETKIFNIKLGSYQLSSPSGILAKSANTRNSLSSIFSYKPFDVDVDSSLVVKAAPCYITYLKKSIDDISHFFKNQGAVSQTLAVETAAAVQMTLDEVKRTAQKQVDRALKDHTRILLDLDIAAPKLKIPTSFYPDNVNATNMFVDLGNLLIRSRDHERKSKELDMYAQFDLVLSDVSAFLVDGDYQWDRTTVEASFQLKSTNNVCLLPVIDKCGVILHLEQIRVENASYPSTRLSVRLPALKIHFSPARYHRLMHVIKIFQEDDQKLDLFCPWDRPDFEGWVSLLTRKGMGNREAIWHWRYACIVGAFVYILEDRGLKSYKQYISLRGKQLYQLFPEFFGGVPHTVAICQPGTPMDKVIEDVNAIILRCDSEESQITWHKRLREAVYLSSGFAPITSTSDSSDSEELEKEADGFKVTNVASTDSMFLIGLLDELRILFTYSSTHDQCLSTVLVAKERCLFEFRAIGGQVELAIRENDLFMGTILKSLEIEDLVSCSPSSQKCYLVRSFIYGDDDDGNEIIDGDEGDDRFYEVSDKLTDSDVTVPLENFSDKPPSFSSLSGLIPGESMQTRMTDVEIMKPPDSFIKAQVVMYDQNSSIYEKVDMQVLVTLATLSFFCRRPTILAILDFVNSINIKDKSDEHGDNILIPIAEPETSEVELVEDNERKAVRQKGLLGQGKSRVIFDLVLKMKLAQISLMNENGSKLCTLSQKELYTNIKVFPSSYAINASLGNLKISDDGLDDTHLYFWICDMRNPMGNSFVELSFSSFSPDDDDYDGYEYSLCGQLSEVRLVYLNRFVQEVVNYFMGLVQDNSRDVVKLKDQKSNTEKWFTLNDIEGSPALKLDLSLKKPIILIPRRTDSPEYLKLDVMHITVCNTFQWLSGARDEIKAVHLEILTIQVEDINLNVGMGMEMNESIIKEVTGLSVMFQRSLRDLLHQLPTIKIEIQIKELKAALSNKEYQIISECAMSNFSETPRLIPALKHGSKELLSDTVEPVLHHEPGYFFSESQNGGVWISAEVSVCVNMVELSLHPGEARDASLATMQVTGLWLFYKLDNRGEGFLSATLKGFSVIDDREGTADEFKLAIGMLHNNENSATEAGTCLSEDSGIQADSAMLILDAKLGQNLTAISLCVQRPQMLVALDFFFAFVEFFVPSVGSILSKEDKDPIDFSSAVILDQHIYRQPCSELSLSPLRPLVADHVCSEHFIYDGNGGILYLRDRQGAQLTLPSKEPMLFVGHGKKLQFINVTIKGGPFIDSCVWLGSNSAYLALEKDKVYLEAEYEEQFPRSEFDNEHISQDTAVNSQTEFVFEFQAIGPELTFFNTSQNVVLSPVLSNKLLYAQFDAYSRLVKKRDMLEATANVLGFFMESNGFRILEPFDTSVKFSNTSGKMTLNATVSDIFMTCTFSILKLFLAVEEDILTFLQRTSQKLTVFCSQFDKIGTIKDPVSGQIYAFWRPCAPPGFAVLGDYLTPTDKPPSKGVLVVNTNIARVKKPISYRLIWPPSNQGVTDLSTSGTSDLCENKCFIWLPEAPKGYVSMGCVVSFGSKQPSSSSGFCIWAPMVSPCSFRDCITINYMDSSSLTLQRVCNSAGSFLPADLQTRDTFCGAYELRNINYALSKQSCEALNRADKKVTSPSNGDSLRLEKSTFMASGRHFDAIASFKLIWWNRGSKFQKEISIWRPIISEGRVFFGDIAVKGFEPPSGCIVLQNAGDENLFTAPIGYQLVQKLKKQTGVESISFWNPQAPPGYVSLGCVALKGDLKQNDLSRLRCIRSDLVIGDQFLEESIFSSDAKFSKENFSLWAVDNELGTFIASSGSKRPPRRFAFKLADPCVSSSSDEMSIDAKVGTFSAAIFDDYGGLMVPLVNVSLSGVLLSYHGSSSSFTSSVSFALVVRSFNDKCDAWEPFIEPLDLCLRYQYNLNSSIAPSQLRVTSTGNLNLNVSVSNMNMILQAYASWNILAQANNKRMDGKSSTSGTNSALEAHNRPNFYIIPRNKLGRDISIQVPGAGGRTIMKLSSGDMKPVIFPVLRSALNSHMKGQSCAGKRKLVTVMVADAQFPKTSGLGSNIFAVSIHLSSCVSESAETLIPQQIARTSGSISTASSDYEIVNWNETFFFKVDSKDYYILKLILTDIGKGEDVAFISFTLKDLDVNNRSNCSPDMPNQYLGWIDLHSSKCDAMDEVNEPEKFNGRVRLSMFVSPNPEVEELSNSENMGAILISPTVDGPWTNVRLNYAAPAACWRLGNAVVASEVTVTHESRIITIRSLVSVLNNSNFVLDLRLVNISSGPGSVNDGNKIDEFNVGGYVETDEFFEHEKLDASLGWVRCSNNLEDAIFPESLSAGVVKSGWKWIDDWHLDNSAANTSDGWVYSSGDQNLHWPEATNFSKVDNFARQRRWVRNRMLLNKITDQEIHIGFLEPGDSLPLPLTAVQQDDIYILQLRPLNRGTGDVYSWSSSAEEIISSHSHSGQKCSSGLHVSGLSEMDALLYCEDISSGPSIDGHKLWFCARIQSVEIGKDISSCPIHDWIIELKPPLCISNFLPLAAEYSVYDSQSNGNFVACARGICHAGETVKIHSADIRNPLFLSMFPQRGWIPVNEAVLISHPNGIPPKTMSIRSSISGRIAQLILEQNYIREQSVVPRNLRVYAPYWFSIARCPPLTLRLVQVSSQKPGMKINLPFHSVSSKKTVLDEILAEELCEGHTIASALSLKQLGLAASFAESFEDHHFGPLRDLSALSDMDESLDLFARDADSNYLRLFVSTKPCPYQSVPTKVISVRPFMTFTNRVGQDILIKLNDSESKVLHASDSRISLLHSEIDEIYKIQVRLVDTEWSYPIPITKEDTIFLILRTQSGSCTYLRIEVRGFEEGSRFIVVFRFGPADGPLRIENRTCEYTIRVRQDGFGDNYWFTLDPLTTVNFAWENPYGERIMDTLIIYKHKICMCKLDLQNAGTIFVGDEETKLQVEVVHSGQLKVVRFTPYSASNFSEECSYLRSFDSVGNSVVNETSGGALEMIIELGVIGISLMDHRPKELLFLHLERVFLSYSTGYDSGTASRLKLILGYLQLDNQLPLTSMPVLLGPESAFNGHHPVFKMTITARHENIDDVEVYPYIYLRVSETVWRINIHEPIIWFLLNFYHNLQLDHIPDSSRVTQVDPEIRIELIDISEIRLKVSLETESSERPHRVLGIWNPVLSALGSAFKIQVNLRRVLHKDRFMRKSSILSALRSRIWRDLIHNPLHLIFSVDILGMTSSTLASISNGFAELSTDGQFLKLRTKQVGSRRITGVREGIIQGTEALAQGVAFGVSGVVTKPMESARGNGLFGFAHGLGLALLGFFAQPVSGALDFFSLTVDGLGASYSKCLEFINNKVSSSRTRFPRAIHADGILKEYSEKEAFGQMILHLAESTRRFGCTEIFKERSKFAWSDLYEDHFMVPYQRVVLITNKRVMLLQCLSLEKVDRKPSKILWDIPWEELLALEVAPAGCPQPSHICLHLKTFRRSEKFIHTIKCHVEDEVEEGEPRAVTIYAALRQKWKTCSSALRSVGLKVPSRQKLVYFPWSDDNGDGSPSSDKTIVKSRDVLGCSSNSDRFVKHSLLFQKIWSSELEPSGRCRLCRKQAPEDVPICTIWRPICSDGYVSIGDVAHIGTHEPSVAAIYRNDARHFAAPLGYDLVWRNCLDDYVAPLSIWHPKAPEGFVSPGCVAVASFDEPKLNSVFCVSQSLTEETQFEEQRIWTAPASYPWPCHIYQVKSSALPFVALRQTKEESNWIPLRIVDSK